MEPQDNGVDAINLMFVVEPGSHEILPTREVSAVPRRELVTGLGYPTSRSVIIFFLIKDLILFF